MSKVFISYARRNGEHARRLYDALCSVKKLEPWIDTACLPPGGKWRPAIRKAIRETDYFLALISKESATSKGIRNTELDQALGILKEFPEGHVFLIPLRLDECEMPREELEELTWVDLFPDWNTGIKKLFSEIAPGHLPRDITTQDKTTRTTHQYYYRIGLVDLDLGLTNLGSIAESLNNAQEYFHFMRPEMPSLKMAVVSIEGMRHLAIYKVPKSFITEHQYLSVDLVSCFTKFPLAFLEKGYVYYNYFAGPSDQDERFLFVSTDQLYEFCKRAGRRFEEGLVHTLVGQLTAYFTTIGYHDETRGCVMDFCEMREKQIVGLKARKYCDACECDFPDGDLKNALKAILSWEY